MRWHIVWAVVLTVLIFVGLYFLITPLVKVTANTDEPVLAQAADSPVVPDSERLPTSDIKRIKTPPVVRAIYMTSWVASQHEWRMALAKFIRDSDLNSIVIDVKDYSGVIAFDTGDPVLAASGAQQVRVPDLKDFIATLHEMGIYVIARISVFQDPIYAAKHPSQAVQTRAGAVWKDRNGLHFVDPAATPYWDYIVRLSKASIAVGFDELNFDYVRYPTDGNLKDISYPVSGPKMTLLDRQLREKRPTGSVLPTAKQTIMTEFFAHLSESLRPLGVPLSVDLFGMTMTAVDDVSIGQVLESALPYFDYICPMVYPSHYPSGFRGYANPASHPYEIIHFVMKEGMSRVKAAGYGPQVLRPWLQDFNLGATYDEAKVRAQIRAAHDAGVQGWLMWDPRNRYTRAAYSGQVPKSDSISAGEKQAL